MDINQNCGNCVFYKFVIEGVYCCTINNKYVYGFPYTQCKDFKDKRLKQNF